MRPQFQPRRIAVVAFDGVEPLDVTGPASVFAKAADMRPGSCEVVVASPRGGSVRGSGGVSFADTVALAALPAELDTVLVAGGEESALHGAFESGLPQWLASRASSCRRIGSICTGAFVLAAAGLLDGRRATTHWRAADRLRASFPAVRVDPEPIYLHDGVYTSAGVTAGIDLALKLVADDHGQPLANAIARELVVYARRAGGQSQYSGALAAQARASGRLAPVIDWILENLTATLRVPEIAARASVSERTLARLFAKDTGTTPARFVAQARVDRAMLLLETTDWPLERVSERVGLGSVDALQRAFRGVGLGPPSAYRRSARPPS